MVRLSIHKFNLNHVMGIFFTYQSMNQANTKSMPHIVRIRLDTSEVVDGNILHFIAARSSDRRYSYTGSGLPFTNAEQAFHATQNMGEAKCMGNNMFEISLNTIPNSYYEGLGTRKVPPRVNIWWLSNGVKKTGGVQIGKSIPFRSLTFPPNGKFNRDVMLYDNEFKFARSQERILLESAYPSYDASVGVAQEPENFWGTRPPV